jgi:large subunit ribosomal protein L10
MNMAQDYVIEPAKAKVENVAELRELVGATKGTILLDYRGLSVAELTTLRKKLRTADAEFRVVKNTLFKRAAAGLLPVDEMAGFLAGPTAISFAKGDTVAAAKVMVDFVKEHKAVSLKAGVMDGKMMSVAEVEALSKTPPREVLISMMLGSMQAPISGLVGTLNGIVSNFVFTLQAVADQKATA